MRAAKKVVLPSVALLKENEQIAALEVKPDPPKPTFIGMFAKLTNPQEVITFTDGTKFTFPSRKFATSDEKLIQQISEVAERYGIFRS